MEPLKLTKLNANKPSFPHDTLTVTKINNYPQPKKTNV